MLVQLEGPSLFSGLDYWTGLLDWTTGLDYWTGLLDSQKLPLEEKGTAMRRAKTPGHKACSMQCCSCTLECSVVFSTQPPSLFFVSGREPGRDCISTPPTSAHAHYELHVESVCVMRCSRVAWVFFTPLLLVLTVLLSSSSTFLFSWWTPNVEPAARRQLCNWQWTEVFRSGFYLWNGELGFKARFYLASLPGLLAPIFDRFCKKNKTEFCGEGLGAMLNNHVFPVWRCRISVYSCSRESFRESSSPVQ